MFDTTWDAIVIGSGVGGLITAALLSKKEHKRVLVLEAHNRPGGFTHTFTRQGRFQFDVGVHYVGGMPPGSELRGLFDFASAGRLNWIQLPEDMDHLYFENEEVVIPANGREFRLKLQNRFPSEKAALDWYFQRVSELASAYILWNMSENFPLMIRALERLRVRWSCPEIFKTTESVLRQRFANPRLIEILTSQWGGFGLPPRKSSFGFHCVHVSHYLEGAWFPEGGSEQIANTLIQEIEKHGGQVATRAKVESILTERGGVRGVRVRGQDILCDLVISNAGAKRTYLELLDCEVPFRNELARLAPGPSALVIYLGLHDSPAKLGLNAANHWFLDGSPLYLSFPSMKQSAQAHTAELMAPLTEDEFVKWKPSNWKRRPEDYEKLKQKLIESALERVECRFPGFKELVAYVEASTPLTVRHFHGAPDGAIFGLPAVPERFQWPWATSRTPLTGLYLTGSDVLSSGVGGAALGGLKTFDAIRAPGNLKNSLQIRRQLRNYNRDVSI